jgi:hypothetical protein
MTTRLKRAIGLGLVAVVIALLISLGGVNADNAGRSTEAVALPAAAPSWTGAQAGRMIIPAADATDLPAQQSPAPIAPRLVDRGVELGVGKTLPALT